MDIQEIKSWKYPTRQMMREAIWWLIERVEYLEQLSQPVQEDVNAQTKWRT